jgi:hypothetical protein
VPTTGRRGYKMTSHFIYMCAEAAVGLTIGGLWGHYWSGRVPTHDREQLILPYAKICCYVIIGAVVVESLL